MKVTNIVGILATILSTTAFADTVIIKPQATSAICYAGLGCQVAGTQDIDITNDSDQDFNYRTTFLLYADNRDTVKETKSFPVKAHERFTFHHGSILIAKFNIRGNHQLYSSATVEGRKGYQNVAANVVNVI